MKFFSYILFGLLAMNIALQAQTYPLVTIQDIQRVPDSLQNSDPPSQLNGDTVRIRALVMVQPVIHPVNNRGVIISAGARWSIYAQDPSGAVWGGMNIIQHDTIGAAQGTFFDLVDTAQVWEFTGKVEEYFTSTQFALITAPQPVPVEFINQNPNRVEPIELSLADFFSNGNYNFNAEKYEGMYVIVRNVITSDRQSAGNFKLNDGLGNFVFAYNQSRHFKTGTAGIDPNYQPPLDGSVLSYVRGIVTTRADGYYIVPLYPGDVGPSTSSPPVISQITRNNAIVNPNSAVLISAKLADLDGYVTSASLKYRVNGGSRISLPMQKNPSDTTQWQASIPGVTDSSLVDFFISATDNENNVANNPSDTVKGNYFYLVLNRPLTIVDVQYSPFGSGFSGYNNYSITLDGIVTADTSDIPGLGSTPLRIYMQDGNSAWSGIQIGAAGTFGNDILTLKRGDKITVTGKILESFAVTRIDSITNLSVASSNNPLPAPAVVTTGTIATKINGTVDAEQWESVLIKYQNVNVTNYTADGSSNFGESFIDDGSGNTRVEWQDGGNTYHNAYDSSLIGLSGYFNVTTGSTFSSIVGILYYSFSNYKLVPRKNDDMTGFVADANEEVINPDGYSLLQNYPNPFNPSTVISYQLPASGNVSLKVFDILGNEIATLIDNDFKEAGYYNYLLSTVNFPLSSGIYFYRLQAGNFVQTKKMILLR